MHPDQRTTRTLECGPNKALAQTTTEDMREPRANIKGIHAWAKGKDTRGPPRRLAPVSSQNRCKPPHFKACGHELNGRTSLANFIGKLMWTLNLKSVTTRHSSSMPLKAMNHAS